VTAPLDVCGKTAEGYLVQVLEVMSGLRAHAKLPVSVGLLQSWALS
jgi:hypothetical protein